MAKNTVTVDVSVTGAQKASSGLAGMAKSLLGVAAAFAAVRKGAEILREVTDANRQWESGMQDANRMLGLSQNELARMESRLLSTQGPLQYVTDLYDELPDALYRAASAGQDATHMMTDLDSIARLAAASHQSLGDTTDRVMRIMRAFSLENGNAAVVTNVLVGAEQQAIATGEELAAELAQLAPAFQVTGESIYTTAAALAATTKAGFNANVSATALRTGWARLQTAAVKEKLAALGVEVTDFASTMEQLRDAGLGEEDWIEIFGVRHYSKFFGLVSNWERFDEAIVAIKEADVSSMFNDYARTAAAAADVMENQTRAEMIRLGEQVQPTMLQLEKFGLEAKKIFAELAVGIMKNWEGASAAALGFIGILNILNAHPVIAAITLIGAGIMAIIASTKDANIALRDHVRAQREATAERRGAVDAMRDEAQAQLAAAEAAGDNEERIRSLTEAYRDLTAASLELTVQELELSIQEAELTAAIERRKAAEEIGGGGADGLFAEAQLDQLLESTQGRLKTEEDIIAAQQALNDLQMQNMAAYDDEAAIRENILAYLVETTGATEEYVDDLLEANIGLEEADDLAAFLAAEIERASTALSNGRAIIDETVIAEHERLGIAEGMNLLAEQRVDYSAAELQNIRHALEVERAVVEARAAVLQQYIDTARESGRISLIPGIIREAETLDQRVESLRAGVEAYQSVVGSVGSQPGEEEPAREPGGAGAETEQAVREARENIQKTLEGTGLEWYITFTEQTRRGWDDFTDHGRRAVDEVGKKLGESLAVQKEALVELAGVFEGLFSDENYNIWDSFKQLGLKVLDELVMYAAISGLFSLTGTPGASGYRPGGIAGGLLDILGFAEGGYVTQPTMAMVGEGRSPEWILPEADVRAAMQRDGVEGLLRMMGEMSGRPMRAQRAAVPGSTTIINNSYGLAVGSLDRMDAFQRRATARQNRRAYS